MYEPLHQLNQFTQFVHKITQRRTDADFENEGLTFDYAGLVTSNNCILADFQTAFLMYKTDYYFLPFAVICTSQIAHIVSQDDEK